MSETNHCHPLQHRGATQIGRLAKALSQEAFRLDERTIQELIVEAHRFAHTLRFFDETNTQPEDAWWDRFWEVEILTYLAIVAAADTDEMRRQYQELDEQFGKAKPVPGEAPKVPEASMAAYRPLLENLRMLALSLEEAYQKLVRIQHPLQTLLLNRIRRDNCCDEEELEGALKKLIGYHKGAVKGLSMSLYAGFFSPDKRWGIENKVDYDAVAANPRFSQDDLRELFHTFYNTWVILRNAAQADFEAELARMELPEDVEYRIVQPHIVLFLVFLRLFRYAQESLNDLGDRHLAFYYEEVLGLKRRGEIPDEVYLLFELAKDFDQYLLEKGTEFLAGKDKNGQPLLFETVEDWVLRPAQVADIKNTWIDLQCGGIHANPDVSKAYENGAEKPNESATFWRSMGDDRHLPHGEVGFAIASPQLILREGKRVVDIKLTLTPNRLIGRPERLKPEYFQIYLSSPEDWIKPGYHPSVIPDSTSIPDLAQGSFGMTFEQNVVRIRVVLERDDPPVDSLGEEPAAKAGFDTAWPIIKVIINPLLEKPCPTDAIQNLTSASVYEILRILTFEQAVIRVDVRGIRENLIIQSDQGVFDGTQKVFPFGPVPEVGNRFYIGSTEVFQKALDSLQIRFEWIAPPASFREHYKEYSAIRPLSLPTPNPKVLIEFVDRADDRLIILRQVLRDGVLPNADTPIRIKISDINFDSNSMAGLRVDSSSPGGAQLRADPNEPGLYFLSLTQVFFSHNDPTITLSKGASEDFEPLTLRLKDANIIPAFLELVLFPREKIFENYSSVNLIQGRVTDIFGDALSNATIDGTVAPTSGDYSISKPSIPTPTLSFAKAEYENASIQTRQFSVIDAVLLKTPKVGPPPGSTTTFSTSLSGVVNSLRISPGGISEVFVAAKNASGGILAITKTTSSGNYAFPNIAGATSIEIYHEDNEQDKLIATPTRDKLNASILPARIEKRPPTGNINIGGTVSSAEITPQTSFEFQVNTNPAETIGPAFNQSDVPADAQLKFAKSGYQTLEFNAKSNTRFDVLMLPASFSANQTGSNAGVGKVQITVLNSPLPNLSGAVTASVSGSSSAVSGNIVTIDGFTGTGNININCPGFEPVQFSSVGGREYGVTLAPIIFKDQSGTANQITGTIRRMDGSGFAGARVIASNGANYYEVLTNNSGAFTIHLPAGSTNYQLTALYRTASNQYMISSSPVNTNVEGRAIEMLLGHITRSRPAGATVRGFVKGTDGKAVFQARIVSGSSTAFTDENGRFQINTSSQLEISHPLFEALTVPIDDNSDIHITMLPLRGKGRWVFTGTVSDIFGVALRNVSIGIITQVRAYELGRSGSDGKYRIAIPDSTTEPVQKVIFKLAGFKDVEFNFPPQAPQGADATHSLMDVRMSYDEFNLTPLIENDNIQGRFGVKINALNLTRDVRTQFFDKYSPTLKRGFLRLTLKDSDFLHAEYPKMLTWYALYAANQIALDLTDDRVANPVKISALQSPPSPPPVPNPPYTPATNNISLDYTSTQIITGPDNGDHIDQYYHLLPFNGHKWLSLKAVPPASEVKVQMIYPYMPDDTLPVMIKNTAGNDVPAPYAPGNLFIGISQLQPGGALSLLFQIAEGTEPEPEALAPAIHWSYLTKDNRWAPFKTGEIISDNTAGLTRSGMIQFAIPSTAVKENTMLNAEYFWLRAAARQADLGKAVTKVQALPSMTGIRAQAVKARFKNAGNELSHLGAPLPAETVTKLLESRTAVKKVEQPLESFGGRLPESMGRAFYHRVAERLRHKDRAVTAWDFEHLLLERFPETAAAKCIQHTRYKPADAASELAPGYVTVGVIPDLKKRKGEPWEEPRFTQGALDDMRAFLASRSNLCVAFGKGEDAHLQVLNPLYEKVDVMVIVAFMPGVDEAFFKQQLETELRHYISPWLADPGRPPAFGRTLERSAILQFIEERPYINYVDLADAAPGAPSKFLVRMQVIDKAGRPVVFTHPDPIGNDTQEVITTIKSKFLTGKICPSTARSILVAGSIVVGSVNDPVAVKLPPMPAVAHPVAAAKTGGTGTPSRQRAQTQPAQAVAIQETAEASGQVAAAKPVDTGQKTAARKSRTKKAN